VVGRVAEAKAEVIKADAETASSGIKNERGESQKCAHLFFWCGQSTHRVAKSVPGAVALGGTPKIIVQTDDVIFAEIISSLNLDEDE
jgi:hypothetical protein